MADFLGRLRRLVNPERNPNRNAGQPGSASAPSGEGDSGGDRLPDAAGQLDTLTAMGLTFEDWATPERMRRDLIRNIDHTPPGPAKPGGRHRRGVYWWPLEVYPRLASPDTRWRVTLFPPSREQRRLWRGAGPLEGWDDYLSAQARAFPGSLRPRELVVLDHTGTDSRGRLDLLIEGEPCALAVRDFSDLAALDAAQSLLFLAAPAGKAVVAPEPGGMSNARACFLVDADHAAEFRLLWRRHLEPLRHDAHRHARNRPPEHAAALETPGLPPEGTPPPALELPVPEVPLAEQLATLRRLGLETAPGVGEEQLAAALEELARPCPDGSPDPGVGPYRGLLRLRKGPSPLLTLEAEPEGPGWAELEERFLAPLKAAEKEFADQLMWFRLHEFERHRAEDERLDVHGHLRVLARLGFPLGDLPDRSEGELRTLVEDSLSPAGRPSVWRGLFHAEDAGAGKPVLGHTYLIPDGPLDYFGVWEQIVRDIAEAAGTAQLVDSVSSSGEGEDGGGDGVLRVGYAGKVHEFRPEYLGKHLDHTVLGELCDLLCPPGHAVVGSGGLFVWVREDRVDEFRRRILPALG